MRRLKFPLSYLRKWWQQRSIVQQGTIAITIPLLCLVTSLSAHLLIRQTSLKIEKAVDHSQAVLLESHSLLLAMLNAETGVRGYYAGSQTRFLQPYNQALTVLPQNLDRLQDLVQDNPTQVEQTKTLQMLADQQLGLLRSGIRQIERLPPSNTRTNALNLALIDGKTVMDQFRRVVEQLEAEEQNVLGIRQQSLQQYRDLNVIVILLGIMISGVGSAVAITLFRGLAQEIQQREFLLQENRNLIRAIFANVVDGVIIFDGKLQIEDVNQSAERMFGYSLQALAGQNWLKFLTHETDVSEDHLSAKALPCDRPWQAMGHHKNGTWFPIEFSISAIEFDDRHIVIIRDVTERQQTAAKLQSRAVELAALNTTLSTTNTTLSERNRELDQFAYVVSHDLKAPLRAIANLSAWIEEDLAAQLPPESQQHMQLLRNRVYRLEALLNGLLDYARIGRSDLPIESVDVAVLLANIIKIIAPPPTFNIEIVAPLPVLPTRRLLLQQVLTHLIENAINHHPTQTGTVKVSVQDQGDRYEFTIADNGQGIDPRFHHKIYTIFQTLQSRDFYESRGIGLALVKKIVEMEGGSINLKSAVGAGATFQFTWLKQPLGYHPSLLNPPPIDRAKSLP